MNKNFLVVLNSIYKSDLPANEKTHQRLFQEAFTLIGAGSETTGLTQITTTFHLLANPRLPAKLQRELSMHFPDYRDVLISYRDL